jgi:hypothetical protein
MLALRQKRMSHLVMAAGGSGDGRGIDQIRKLLQGLRDGRPIFFSDRIGPRLVYIVDRSELDRIDFGINSGVIRADVSDTNHAYAQGLHLSIRFKFPGHQVNGRTQPQRHAKRKSIERQGLAFSFFEVCAIVTA